MEIKNIAFIALLAAGVLLVPAGGFSEEAAATKQSASKPSYQLLFFMNPNGRPCQMQDSIIKGIGDSLKSAATVKYYKTTEQADREAFGTYGVRSLPSLIIIDGKGKEVKRFTPGVQDGATILAALPVKKKAAAGTAVTGKPDDR